MERKVRDVAGDDTELLKDVSCQNRHVFISRKEDAGIGGSVGRG